MIRNDINIKMIQSAIDKGIADIEDDPKRGIRNLVDLANHFAKSPFQRDITSLMQSILVNLESPYYDLVLDLLANVDQEILKRFGINLAYKGWTYGAKKIRKNEEKFQTNIPWTLIFDLRKNIEDSLPKNDIEKIIKEGKELGIYTYNVFINNLKGIHSIIEANLDCAFILFLPPSAIKSEDLRRINSYKNTCFSLYYEPGSDLQAFNKSIQVLVQNKSLFTIYSYAKEDYSKYILSDNWIKDLHKKIPFQIFIDPEGSDNKSLPKIQDYIFDSRTSQKYSIFLIDLYKDIARINMNISNKSSILTIKEDGYIYNNDLSYMTSLNIRDLSLKEIFSNIKEE